MKAITLRDIPDEIGLGIQRRADSTGSSLNKTVIELLSTVINPPRHWEYHDLDHLIGRWSNEDTVKITESLDSQRVIDAELWK